MLTTKFPSPHAAPVCDNEGEVFSTCASACPSMQRPHPTLHSPLQHVTLDLAAPVLWNSRKRDTVEMHQPWPISISTYLELFRNGSNVQLSDISEGDNRLIFWADLTDCCQARRIGNCNGPDKLKICCVSLMGDKTEEIKLIVMQPTALGSSSARTTLLCIII